MTRKLVVFNDHSWKQPQYRSKKRPVSGNASLAETCLANETTDGLRQISLLQCDSHDQIPFLRSIKRNFGLGIKRELVQAYQFLVQNYMPGDEIYLIGAGRGAFTIQCLANFISVAGLLQADSLNKINKALTYCRLTKTARKGPAGRALRESYNARIVPIRFVGCWDAVGSHGAPTRGIRNLSILWTEFLSETVSANVQTAFHALALDETNPAFKPHLWTSLKSLETKRVEQVWFSGKHQNITGGQRDSRLSDIAFRWLINKAVEEGLHFDARAVDDLSSPDAMGCVVEETRTDTVMSNLGLKSSFRPVGKADSQLSRQQIPGTEKIHYSVLEKDKKDTSYSPKAYEVLPPSSLSIALDEDFIHHSSRRHSRIAVNYPATLMVDNSRYNGNVMDFSEGGARIWLHLDVPIGTPVKLKSSMLREGEFDGRIVWTKDQSLGVEFMEDINLENLTFSEDYTLQ